MSYTGLIKGGPRRTVRVKKSEAPPKARRNPPRELSENQLIIKTMEKLVEDIQNLQQTNRKLVSRLREIERVVPGIKETLETHDSQITILDHNVHAPDQLDSWMIDESAKDSSDFELSYKDIKRGLKRYGR